MAKKKKTTTKLPFAINDYVVYPTHGVGQITGIQVEEISGTGTIDFSLTAVYEAT